MKRGFLPLIFFCFPFSQPLHDTISKEDFVNEIINQVVDSSFSRYYLVNETASSGFKKYDFDEWAKYGMVEKINFSVLNELAKKSYEDTSRDYWLQEKLLRAICIPSAKAEQVLNPAAELEENKEISDRDRKKAIRKEWKVWVKKPLEERTVFSFSKPAFSDDDQYAVISVAFRCDISQCGMGTIYIFRREGPCWKMAGKMIIWVN